MDCQKEKFVLNRKYLVCPISNSVRLVKNQSIEVRLEPRLIAVLGRLATTPFETVKRNELIHLFWFKGQSGDEALTLAISRIRKEFMSSFGEGSLIHTVPRKGYRLMAEVEGSNCYESSTIWTETVNKVPVAIGVLTLLIVLITTSIYPPWDEDSSVSMEKITNMETSYPSWSRDGSLLAVQSNREDSDSEIYIMTDRGQGIERLTFNEGLDEYPSISPSGDKVLFTSSKDGNQEIYVMNLDGSDQRNLTRNSSRDILPRWHPDGGSLIFNSNRQGNLDLFKYELGTGVLEQITHSPDDDKYASWSPNGDRLVFVRIINDKGEGNAEIFLKDTFTDAETRLTHSASYDSWPSWSDDGRQIFYSSNLYDSKSYQLYVMNRDGSNKTKLTAGESENASFTKPFQAPDGSGRVVCTRTKDGNVEIFIIHNIGQSSERLVYQHVGPLQGTLHAGITH